jgi:hypothetical protein
LLIGLRHVAEKGRVEVIGIAAAGLLLYALLYYVFGAAPAERAHVGRLLGRPAVIGRHYRRA